MRVMEPASSYNRFVDIVRAIDGYDWRNEAGSIRLDEFLASIRATAMAGCREIQEASDADERLINPKGE